MPDDPASPEADDEAAGGDPKRLTSHLPDAPTDDADDILERFLAWVGEVGLDLYEAQEEAILELMGGRHVILNTPTGSGKSLVALALHFKCAAEGKRCWYTSPIKALVNEKFFDLCQQLGAERVGMMTGDATVNPDAPILCCTAEVLANSALREGAYAPVDAVVMDEFHYYSDPDRGWAWQVPLLTLPQARFLLMSATLGDVSRFEEAIPEYSGGELVTVTSAQRPVPLTFEYRETPLQETIGDLAMSGQAPVYVVNFTQREASEQAQSLTSVNVTTKEEKKALLAAMHGFTFDTPYGKDVQRFLKHGIGVHHAGLLPKYRTLVERLAQAGHLKLICGTDTLGVGVNVPIRTVLFTKLCKFDGEKVGILTVRDFKQIAGRAGRKGFDDQGWVVAQAPDHVIENKKLEAKASAAGKKKFNRRKPPERGFVPWDAKTFARLQESMPEALESRFVITHGMLLEVLDREFNVDAPHGGYRRVVEVIGRSYESKASQRRHRRHAAVLFRSLREAGVVEVARPEGWTRQCVRVHGELQQEFSLHHALSLWLLDALGELSSQQEGVDPELAALNILSLVETILEHPRVVLMRQLDKRKGDLVASMKAEGVEYDERMNRLETVEHDKPLEEFVYRSYNAFRATRPWLRGDNVRPKSIARDLLERYLSFNDYIKEYGLARSEGVLLRYLSQAYKTLLQNVPSQYHDDALEELAARLRATLARVDSSLVAEWERMIKGEPPPDEPEAAPEPYDLAKDERGLRFRVRAELHALVKTIADGDFEEAITAVRADPDDAWTAKRLESELEGFVDENGAVRFGHEARQPGLTRLVSREPRVWVAQQTLVGAGGPSEWMLECEVDLREPDAPDGPILTLRRIAI